LKVVSNTSPIINLAAIGQLGLLHQLYGPILIPQAVFDEIAVVGAGQPGAREVRNPQDFPRHSIQNHSLCHSLQLSLDDGEAEAITCAMETQADLLLLDERRGYRAATALGLNVVGVLGVLLEAHHKKLIGELKPLLDDLRSKADFWIAAELYQSVLKHSP